MQKIITGTKYIKVVASETGDILHVPDKYLGHKLSGNVKTFFARKFSKEHYYTDEYGWRIGKKEKKNKKIDFFISGASLVLGSGVEYEDTIGCLLSKKIKKNIVNIAVEGYNDIQILRQIDVSSKKKKPKVVIMVFEDLIGRAFRQDGMKDIIARPFFKKNIKTNKFELIEPNSIPFFLYKRFVKLKIKGRKKNLNLFDKLEEFLLLLFFDFINNKVKNFLLRLVGLNNYNYVSSDNRIARRFILKLISKRINKLVEKYNYNILIYPIYPYMSKKNKIKRFYNEIELLSKLISKESNSKKIFIDKSKDLEKAHKSFFKKNNIKIGNFVNSLQWSDNNHPTPKGTKLIANCIYKSIIKFKILNFFS